MTDLKILWRIVIVGGAVLLLTRCTTAPVTPDIPDVDYPKPAGLESTCPAPGAYQAVDLSQPITRKFLEAMRHLKVRRILRYGDWVQETIRNKTLKVSELELLKEFPEIEVGVVFQHNNSKPASFTAERGAIDARRMIELAKVWGMPAGEAMYFGVDWDSYKTSELAAVKAYFSAAAPIIRAAGFKMGAYANGTTLKNLLAWGLIEQDHAWLSNATGWSGTKDFNASMAWVMKQGLPRDCGGINVDFNLVNSKWDPGTWRSQL